MDRTSVIVEEIQHLCQSILGTKEVSQSTLQLCLRILGSSYGGTSSLTAGDEVSVCKTIKKQLARSFSAPGKRNRATHEGVKLALRFDELQAALSQLGVLKNSWAILHLLSKLKEAELPAVVPPFFFATDPQTQPFQSESTPAMRQTPVRGMPTLLPQPAPIPPVEEISGMRVTEQELIRDVLFSFQAINGRYIKLNHETELFVVDPQLALPPSTRDMVLCLCEMGWLYSKVCEFANRATNTERNGLIGQALCFSIQEELTDYYRLIAVLEAQLNQQELDRGASGARGLTLRRLWVWTQDPAERLRLIATFLDGVGALKGGALASCLYMHVRHGDPAVHSFVERLLRPVCVPLFEMVHRWMFEGELLDPYQEFFVGQNEKVEEERLWQEKYHLNDHMLPLFINKELGQKILVNGKAINFIRQCCRDVSWMMDSSTQKNFSDHKNQGLEYGDALKLQAVVDKTASSINSHLIKLLFERFRLMDHLQALKKFMLLGQGDFVTFLMDMLGEELDKQATQILSSNLNETVESAMRCSNANFDSEILDRVAVRLLEASPGDRGWEVFSLDYSVDGPCCAVFDYQALMKYKRMSHALWRIKRVEWSLAGAWRNHNTTTHLGVMKQLSKLKPVFHSCSLARARMLHLTSNLSNYMMFEVLETSWIQLLDKLKVAKDLDSVINAHDHYLNQIMEKALMEDSNGDLMQQINDLLDIILNFCTIQEQLFANAVMHMEKIKKQRERQQARADKGLWGQDLDNAEEDEGQSVDGVPAQVFDELRRISEEYEHCFAELIQTLQDKQVNHEYLRFLTFRLDFNHFYRKQLQNIEDPYPRASSASSLAY